MDNPLYGSPLGAIQIFETEMVGDPWQDWSGVRSPSRAIRRLRRGFKQNIVTRYRANGKCIHDKARNVIYIHPHDAIRLRAAVRAQGGAA